MNRSTKPVGYWLLALAFAVFVMAIIGAITRLTGSGLSMVDWHPVLQVIPPLSHEAWQRAFSQYQVSPQYRLVNHGMTLAEYQQIYFWEWFHRLWGMSMGAILFGGIVFLAARGSFTRNLLPQRPWRWIALFSALFLLGLAQGRIGWFMVQSGLDARPSVSHYRLAMHLTTALTLYSALVWSGLSLLYPNPSSRHCEMPPFPLPHGRGRETYGAAVSRTGEGVPPHESLCQPTPSSADPDGSAPSPMREKDFSASRSITSLKLHALAALILVALTMTWGAFVAGLHAGLVYNTFPLMGGGLTPPDLLFLHPLWLNAFENPSAVQFTHRVLALTTFVTVLALAWRVWKSDVAAAARRIAVWLAVAACCQVGLGISTLVLMVPIALAAAHQAGAIIVLTLVLGLLFALRAPWLSSPAPAA